MYTESSIDKLLGKFAQALIAFHTACQTCIINLMVIVIGYHKSRRVIVKHTVLKLSLWVWFTITKVPFKSRTLGFFRNFTVGFWPQLVSLCIDANERQQYNAMSLSITVQNL